MKSQIVNINRRVRGSISLSLEKGDNILCTVGNISLNIDDWENLIPMSKLSKWYASILMLYNSKSGVYNVLHCQGEHVSFSDRYYTTRAAYELAVSDMEKIGFSYSSLVASLPRMKKYESKEFDKDSSVEINVLPTNELGGEEKSLYNALCASIIRDSQVIIVQNSDFLPPFEENNLLGHPLMRRICSVVDALPVCLRRYMSVAMSVDDNFAKVSDMFQILCCQKNSSAIIKSDAIKLAWDEENGLTADGNYESYAETIAAISDMIDIKGDFSRHGVNGQVKSISDKLESLFTTPVESMTDSQVRMLEELYESKKYRYQDVCAKLREVIVEGNGCKLSIWDDGLFDKELVKNLLSHKNWLACLDRLSYNAAKYQDKTWFSDIKQKIPDAVRKMSLNQQLERYGKRGYELYGIGLSNLNRAKSWNDSKKLIEKVGSDDDLFNNIKIGEWNDYDNLTEGLWVKIRKYVEKDDKGYRDLRKRFLSEYCEKGKWNFLYNGKLTAEEYDRLFDIYKNSNKDEIFMLLKFLSKLEMSEADQRNCSVKIKELLKSKCGSEALTDYIEYFVMLPKWADVDGCVERVKSIGNDFDARIETVKNDRHRNVLLERRHKLLLGQKPRDFDGFMEMYEKQDNCDILSLITADEIKSYIGNDYSRYAELLGNRQDGNLPELGRAIDDVSSILKGKLLDKPKEYCEILRGLKGSDKKNVVNQINHYLDETKPMVKKPALYNLVNDDKDVWKMLKPHRESINGLFLKSGFEVNQKSSNIADMTLDLLLRKKDVPVWTIAFCVAIIVAFIVIVSIQGYKLEHGVSDHVGMTDPEPKTIANEEPYVRAYSKDTLSDGRVVYMFLEFENVEDVISYIREKYDDKIPDSLYCSHKFDSICIHDKEDSVIRFDANRSFLLELLRFSSNNDTKSDSLLYVLKTKIEGKEQKIDTISRISTYINDALCVDSIQVNSILFVRVHNDTVDTVPFFDVKTNEFNKIHKDKMFGVNTDRYCLWLMKQIDLEFERQQGVKGKLNYNF